MHPDQFDQVIRLFAARRISRRGALAAGGGLAAPGLAGAAAQEATPVSSLPDAEDGARYMFVQTFGAGELADRKSVV